MKRVTYSKPALSQVNVRIELGFAISNGDWGEGTPGGGIDENPYGNEL